MNEKNNIIIRCATKGDIIGIISLFYNIYNGQYPDKTVTSYSSLLAFIDNYKKMAIVAIDRDEVVGAVFYQYDEANALAKVYGAAVLPRYRGDNLTSKMMNYGIELISSNKNLDVVYATTRTVHRAAQKLTANLGYKKLGIFPNVHKTNEYETHGLVGKFLPSCFLKRYDNFELHPKIMPLFNLVQQECNLSNLKTAEIFPRKKFIKELPNLEAIDAREFVEYRFENQIRNKCLDMAFYPFHTPNILITSPDQSIEIFCRLNQDDGHCNILGISLSNQYCVITMMESFINILRNLGARYFELIAKAHRTKVIDTMILCGFLPCAYFPALRQENNIRYDYVVFSKSLEALYFSKLELEGSNLEFLNYYYQMWKEISLGTQLTEQLNNDLFQRNKLSTQSESIFQ